MTDDTNGVTALALITYLKKHSMAQMQRNGGRRKDNAYGCGVYDCAGALVDTYSEEPTVFWCECKECGAMTGGEDTDGEAIEAWNRRAEDGKAD